MGGEEQAKPESLPDYGCTAFVRMGLSAFVHGMFNRAIRRQLWMAKYIGSGNTTIRSIGSTKASQSADIGGDRIRSVPYAPMSHPLVEG
jgi:hypothetical protein